MKEVYQEIYMEVVFFQGQDIVTCSGWFWGSPSDSVSGSSIVEEVGEDIFDPGTSVW